QDEVHLLSTSISGGGLLPKGDYFLRSGNSWFVFSVVDTSIVLKEAQDELLAWVLDYETGEPLSGVHLEANGRSLQAGTAVTGDDGLASFPLLNAVHDTLYANRDYVVTLDDG